MLTLGCNQGRVTAADTNNAIAQGVDSLVASLTIAMNDPERENQLTQTNKTWRDWLRALSPVSQALAATCSNSRFTPALGSIQCGPNPTDVTVTATYSSCTTGPAPQSSLAGIATLTFDAKNTCDTWIVNNAVTSGSVTWTTTSMARTDSDLGTETTTSTSTKNYLNAAIGGGVQTTFSGGGVRTVAIMGLTKTHSGGSLGSFSHSLRTTTALSATGTKTAGTRTIASGVVVIDHNDLQVTTTATISNLTWAANCCFPTGGGLSLALKGAINGSGSVSFNTGSCGTVSIVDTFGQAAKIQLQGCE